MILESRMQYEKPKMEIVLIEEDIIRTSFNVTEGGSGSEGGHQGGYGPDAVDPGNKNWWRL